MPKTIETGNGLQVSFRQSDLPGVEKPVRGPCSGGRANRIARLMDAGETRLCVSPSKTTRLTALFDGFNFQSRSASSEALSTIRQYSFWGSARSSPPEVTRVFR